MGFIDIMNLSDEEKLMCIEHVEDFPNALKIDIRSNINNPEFNPLIRKGNTPRISVYSSLYKYADEERNRFTEKAQDTDYQREFCNINGEISKEKIFREFSSTLSNLLSKGFYDAESAITTEQVIADLITNIPFEEIKESVGYFCTHTLIPMKAKGYDFYSYLSTQEYMENVSPKDFRLMEHITSSIANIDRYSGTTSSKINDLGILTYLYFKELGVENVIEKYGFDKRFNYYFERVNPELKESVSLAKDLALHGTSSEEAISRLRDKFYLINDGIDKEAYMNLQPSKNFFKVDGSIVQATENTELESVIESVRNITVDDILDYIEEDTKTSDISFYMTDNDLGNLKNINEMGLSTIYDKYTNEMKHVGKYNDEYYLLYKNYYDPGKVFGLSLESTEDDMKNILTVQLPTRYYYKHIPKDI